VFDTEKEFDAELEKLEKFSFNEYQKYPFTGYKKELSDVESFDAKKIGLPSEVAVYAKEIMDHLRKTEVRREKNSNNLDRPKILLQAAIWQKNKLTSQRR